MQLSNRLKAIYDMVLDDSNIVDIGTDHAYLPIALRLRGFVGNIIACDINQSPLKNAEENIKKSKATNIVLRQSDGLANIKEDEADTVIIAGMGGEIIVGILERCPFIKNEKFTLILQPMTGAGELRAFLYKQGFSVIKEEVVTDNGKIYSVICSKFTGQIKAVSPFFYYAGIIKGKTDLERMYLQKQLKILTECCKGLKNIENKKEKYDFCKSAIYEINLLLEK